MITDKELVAFYDRRYTKKPSAWISDERNQFMYEHVKDCAHKTVLDVGAGNGHSLVFLRERWGDSEYHALDLSAVALRIAKAKIPGLITHEGFIEDLNLEPFDLVLCMGTAEHFRNLERGFAKLREVSKMLYLEIPNCLAYSPGDQGYRQTAIGSRQYEWHLPREAWENIITDANFTIRESDEGPQDTWRFVWLLA